MILLIDNYDSFVHNLARYFQRLGQETEVVRNDAIDVATIRRTGADAIVLSPGPCRPEAAGCSLEVARELHTELPMLGVCLGHQAIAAALGAKIGRAAAPMHGRTSMITHQETRLFQGVPNPLQVCRYHSLVVEPPSVPTSLTVTAKSADGTVMALEHATLPVYGLQFHPEAVLTEYGYPLLRNFLTLAGCDCTQAVDPLMADEYRTAPKIEPPALQRPVTF
ncbi:MAG: aminodeoxychorismate/anthranilate synthase component II [Pirellulales bacterium]|nr:aminodeoxychorismate/anthranilate synthase component II [Pirellulales bacterium]